MRSGPLPWLVLAVTALGCAAGDHYEVSVFPEAVAAQVIDSFTVDVTTDFSSEAPISTTTVEIALEPAAIVSSPGTSDITYDPGDTHTGYDSGPPASYSFRPGDPSGGVATQRVRFRCLAAGEVVASFAVTWLGGNPDDPTLTVEHDRSTVAIACQ